MDIDAQEKHIRRLLDFETWARPLLEELRALREAAKAEIEDIIEPEAAATDDVAHQDAPVPESDAVARQIATAADPAPEPEQAASDVNADQVDHAVPEVAPTASQAIDDGHISADAASVAEAVPSEASLAEVPDSVDKAAIDQSTPVQTEPEAEPAPSV